MSLPRPMAAHGAAAVLEATAMAVPHGDGLAVAAMAAARAAIMTSKNKCAGCKSVSQDVVAAAAVDAVQA